MATGKIAFAAAAAAGVVATAAAWNVGVGSRSIIPLVNGRNDFWAQPPDEDADWPGTLVVDWDVGRISVGNGDTQSVRPSC